MAQRLVRAKSKIRDARDPLPRARAGGAARAARRGAGGRLPGLQRRLRGDRRATRWCARDLCAEAHPPRPRCSCELLPEPPPRAARAAGADAAARRAARGARRRRRRAGAARGAGPRALGSRADRRGPGAGRARRCAARPPGPYALQAAIAAVHAEAPRAADTDWPQIVALYGAAGGRRIRSPVVALNRAVAVADGATAPPAGLRARRAPRRGARRLPPLSRGRAPTCCAGSVAGRGRRAYRAALALAENEAERRFISKPPAERRRRRRDRAE